MSQYTLRVHRAADLKSNGKSDDPRDIKVSEEVPFPH